MRNPPGDGGLRQAGTEKRLIDPPHICPFPANLSTPAEKKSGGHHQPLIAPGVSSATSAASIIVDPAFRRQIERLHQRGPRLIAELLAELAAERGLGTIIQRKLARYLNIPDAALDAVPGARQLPPMPPHRASGGQP